MFGARLNDVESDHSLVQPDPGVPGWLDHYDGISRVADSLLQCDLIGPSVPRGIRFHPHGRRTFDQSNDPLVLFLTGAYASKSNVLPIILMVNTTPDLVKLAAEQAKKLGCDTIRAWGVNPEDEVVKHWIEWELRDRGLSGEERRPLCLVLS